MLVCSQGVGLRGWMWGMGPVVFPIWTLRQNATNKYWLDVFSVPNGILSIENTSVNKTWKSLPWGNLYSGGREIVNNANQLQSFWEELWDKEAGACFLPRGGHWKREAWGELRAHVFFSILPLKLLGENQHVLRKHLKIIPICILEERVFITIQTKQINTWIEMLGKYKEGEGEDNHTQRLKPESKSFPFPSASVF